MRAFENYRLRSFIDSHRVLTVLLLGIFYAFSDEVHQLFVPNRNCDSLDFLCDALGLTLGVIIYKISIKKKYGTDTCI